MGKICFSHFGGMRSKTGVVFWLVILDKTDKSMPSKNLKMEMKQAKIEKKLEVSLISWHAIGKKSPKRTTFLDFFGFWTFLVFGQKVQLVFVLWHAIR